MRKLIAILLFVLIGIQVNAQQKLPSKKESFKPTKKLVIIGMTDDHEARITFETSMAESLISLGIDAYQSSNISQMIFTGIDKANQELNFLLEYVVTKGFDHFMVTAVTDVEEKTEKKDSRSETYKIYHLETNLYTISDTKELHLLWGMCLDIYDYQLVALTIDDYVRAIIMHMQQEDIFSDKEMFKEVLISTQ